MKNPVIRTISFVILLAIMVTMTFSISGQLFKFGAMVVASFTATEAQEKEANEKIVRYADLMIDGILGNTASVFGTSKENEIAFDKLKTQLKELKKTGDIVGIYKLTEESIKQANAFAQEKGIKVENPSGKIFIESTSNVRLGLRDLKSPAVNLNQMGPLCRGLALAFTLACAVFVIKKYLDSKVINRPQYLKKMLIYEALIAGVVCVLFPFFWMLCTAFKPSGQELVINASNPLAQPMQYLAPLNFA